MALGRKPIEIVNDGKHQLLIKSNSWERKYLKNVALIQNGFAFSSKFFSKEKGMSLIRIRDIDKETTEDKYWGEYSKDFIINKGDILIGMDGDFKAATWKGKPALLNQRVCRIIPDNKLINPKFLFICLQPYLDAIHSETSAVTVKHLSSKTIGEIPLPFPPLSEQQAIVEKIEELFSELDKGIEELHTAQDQLKVYRQSLLKWVFEGKLTNENVEEGKLPKGWKWVDLGSIAEKVTDGEHTTPKRSAEGVLLLSARNIQNGYLNLSNVDYVPEEEYQRIIKRCNPEYGDVLISCSGSVGRVCAVPRNLNFTLVRSVALVKLNKEKYHSKFFEYLLQSPILQKQIEKGKKATAQANLFLAPIKKLQVIEMALSEQQKVIEALEEKLSVCDQMEQTIEQSLQQAESLRQSILKQAFEGKLVTIKEEVPVYTPKKTPFYQAQLFGYMIATSANNNIDHGEMTLAKNSYLIDKIYGVPTYFDYGRGHLGPYSIQMKSVLYGGSLKQFFKKGEFHIELQNSEKLFKYTNPYETRTKMAMEELSAIFSQYDDKERPYQTELLATVCKVIEDIQTTDLKAVRTSMKEWKIDLKTTKFKNKAEKFSESDTASCLSFIIARGWDKKLIN